MKKLKSVAAILALNITSYVLTPIKYYSINYVILSESFKGIIDAKIESEKIPNSRSYLYEQTFGVLVSKPAITIAS